jgi:hypothetical protein
MKQGFTTRKRIDRFKSDRFNGGRRSGFRIRTARDPTLEIRTMRLAPTARLLAPLLVLAGCVTLLEGCKTIAAFRDDPIPKARPAFNGPKDCSKGGVGCPPVNRKQYYDDHTARYYYFDQSTGRYFWENGDPRF